jgi:hypothetical protein
LAGKLLRGQDGALVQNLNKKRGYRYRSITTVHFQINLLTTMTIIIKISSHLITLSYVISPLEATGFYNSG